MKALARQINPEEYLLAVFSPEERLEAAFRIAREAFKETSLTLADVETAVRKVRRRAYIAKREKTKGRY
jgi:GH35 family endo-1,4-beta-xylanase